MNEVYSHMHMSDYDYHAIKIISFPATPPESPSPVGDTDDAIVVPVSVAVVAVAIIVTIAVVITVTIIVVRYKHLKCATNPTQSDIFSKNLL